MFNVVILENDDIGEDYRDSVSRFLESRGMYESRVVWVKTIHDLIEYTKVNSVQLLIFDQRLEANELGSDAFKKIRERNNRTRGILITGVATAEELSKAESYGPCLFVSKKAKTVVADLSQAVERSVVAYYSHTEDVIEDDQVIIAAKKLSWKKADKLEYRMVSYYVDDPDYIPPESWTEKLKLLQGMTEEETLDIRASTTVVVSTESAVLLEDTGAITLANFEAGLRGHFENKINTSFQSSVDIGKSFKKTVKGPDINQDVSIKYTTCIKYETAVSYKKYIVHCVKTCTCCGQKTYFDTTVLVPNSEEKIRMTTYYSEGDPLVQLI